MRLSLGVRLLLAVICLSMEPALAEEQLEQETIVIKGNQGLPRTLYIAPWKRVGTPLGSSAIEGEIGEETEPLERDLFQRELELQREGYSTSEPSPSQLPTDTAAGSGKTR
jgi:hypothetical protein